MTVLTNQNSIQEEIKSRMKPGNACYHSVQNILSSKNINIKIYRSIILPVVLYVCETWSLTLREERRVRVFENRVLRRIFGPKKCEVTTEGYSLYAFPNIFRVIKSRKMRWAGHVARMVDRRVAYRIVIGTHEGRRPLGTPRKSWEYNIKMDVQEVGWGVHGLDSSGTG
jgi:hypothetical protein